MAAKPINAQRSQCEVADISLQYLWIPAIIHFLPLLTVAQLLHCTVLGNEVQLANAKLLMYREQGWFLNIAFQLYSST